jgi:hypothetical protein
MAPRLAWNLILAELEIARVEVKRSSRERAANWCFVNSSDQVPDSSALVPLGLGLAPSLGSD